MTTLWMRWTDPSESSPSDPARTLSDKTNEAAELSVLFEDTRVVISAPRSLIRSSAFLPDRLIDRILKADLADQSFRCFIELDSEFYLVVSHLRITPDARLVLGLNRFSVNALLRSKRGSGKLKLSYRNTSEWDTHNLADILAAAGSVVSVLMTGWDLGEDDPRRVPFDDHIPKPISSREDVQNIVARSMEVHDALALRS